MILIGFHRPFLDLFPVDGVLREDVPELVVGDDYSLLLVSELQEEQVVIGTPDFPVSISRKRKNEFSANRVLEGPPIGCWKAKYINSFTYIQNMN